MVWCIHVYSITCWMSFQFAGNVHIIQCICNIFKSNGSSIQVEPLESTSTWINFHDVKLSSLDSLHHYSNRRLWGTYSPLLLFCCTNPRTTRPLYLVLMPRFACTSVKWHQWRMCGEQSGLLVMNIERDSGKMLCCSIVNSSRYRSRHIDLIRAVCYWRTRRLVIVTFNGHREWLVSSVDTHRRRHFTVGAHCRGTESRDWNRKWRLTRCCAVIFMDSSRYSIVIYQLFENSVVHIGTYSLSLPIAGDVVQTMVTSCRLWCKIKCRLRRTFTKLRNHSRWPSKVTMTRRRVLHQQRTTRRHVIVTFDGHRE